MQDYRDFAKKNGVELLESGSCQFCGANTSRGVHECIEIFSLGFEHLDYSKVENHIYRFLSVDAHTLQHSEIHGRWINHFHLTRLNLILEHKVDWNYRLSPKLSDHLNVYKTSRQNEYLEPPKILHRGNITTTDVLEKSTNELECQQMVKQWAKSVYQAWVAHHNLVNEIALNFLKH